VQTLGVHFLNAAGRVNLTGHHHPHPTHGARDQALQHGPSVLEVLATIAVGRVPGTHGTREHHGFVMRQEPRQQKSRLLQGVRAVGDQNAPHRWVSHGFLQVGQQQMPVSVGHVLAVDLTDLMDIDGKVWL
jgi:hypothetical protein